MPVPPSNEYKEPLDVRTLRSLIRHGIDGSVVTDLGDGVVKIDLRDASSYDLLLAIASVRSVPGVTDVVC